MIEGLAQGPYVATRAGFDPTTLWVKGNEFTNDPPCPTRLDISVSVLLQILMCGCFTVLTTAKHFDLTMIKHLNTYRVFPVFRHCLTMPVPSLDKGGDANDLCYRTVSLNFNYYTELLLKFVKSCQLPFCSGTVG